MKRYVAMIWTDDAKPGKRVSTDAVNLTEAKKQLERQYGAGTVFDLHNEDDAATPR
jgi:hypothetical protein